LVTGLAGIVSAGPPQQRLRISRSDLRADVAATRLMLNRLTRWSFSTRS